MISGRAHGFLPVRAVFLRFPVLRDLSALLWAMDRLVAGLAGTDQLGDIGRNDDLRPALAERHYFFFPPFGFGFGLGRGLGRPPM